VLVKLIKTYNLQREFKMIKKWLVVATLISLSAGCANIPKQAYNKEANRAIQQITLLEPAAEPDYAVVNLGHPGQSFGLIGALIASGQISAKTAEFSKAIKAKGFDLAAEFKAALVAELEAAGYVVTLQKVARAKPDFLPKYENVPTGSQAVIDPKVSAGYYCAASNSEYIPTVRSSIRMVKPDGKQILYQEQITYGYEAGGQDAVTFPADQKYFFDDFDAIMAKLDIALDGMRKGVPIVAKQIADDLRR
jgi:hypothetical protein